MAKLTPKQQRFVDEYLIDLNATQSAIRAGYSPKTANREGCRLLSNVDIQNEIQIAKNERSKRTKITQDAVLQELAKIGFANMMDYMTEFNGQMHLDFSKLTRDQAAAISEYQTETVYGGEEKPDILKTRFKLLDKRLALVDIGKHLGMFTEKHEVTGKDGAPIAHTYSVTLDEILQARSKILDDY